VLEPHQPQFDFTNVVEQEGIARCESGRSAGFRLHARYVAQLASQVQRPELPWLRKTEREPRPKEKGGVSGALGLGSSHRVGSGGTGGPASYFKRTGLHAPDSRGWTRQPVASRFVTRTGALSDPELVRAGHTPLRECPRGRRRTVPHWWMALGFLSERERHCRVLSPTDDDCRSTRYQNSVL
jgi:hypothetical protein